MAATPAASSAGSTSGSVRADGAEVRVQWPDGTVGPWLHAAADQFATIERDATQIQPWSPPKE